MSVTLEDGVNTHDTKVQWQAMLFGTKKPIGRLTMKALDANSPLRSALQESLAARGIRVVAATEEREPVVS